MTAMKLYTLCKKSTTVHPVDLEAQSNGDPLQGYATDITAFLKRGGGKYVCSNSTGKFSPVGLVFPSADVQQRYDSFIENEVCPLWVMLLVSSLSICMTSVAFASTLNSELTWFYLTVALFRFIPAGLSILYCWILYCKTSSIRKVGVGPVFLANAVIIAQALSSVLVIISRTLVGVCSDNLVPVILCNPMRGPRMLPLDTVIVGLIGLNLAPVLYKTHRIWAVYLSCALYGCSGLVGIAMGFVSTSYVNVIPLVSTVLIGGMVYEHDYNFARAYVALVNMKQILRSKLTAENEKEVMQMQTRELQHLLGNVAHDMKSPVQGFLMELDNLEAVSNAQARKESVRSLRSTCAFMTMMINRAVDYTKASAGIALVPSMGTVSLMAVLLWVRRCVGKSVLGVPVIIEPFDRDMCPQVITDKQWLVENLLCLLSNAMKFSIEGNIVLRCKLISAAHLTSESRSHSNRSYTERDSEWTMRSFLRSSVRSESGCLDLSVREETQQVLKFEVEDGGVGIPVSDRGALFKPFQQGQRRVGGTGLGLYSLSKRIESIGGQYGVTNRADGKNGSCFWFTIPYRPDDVSDVERGEFGWDVFGSSVREFSDSSPGSPRWDHRGSHDTEASVTALQGIDGVGYVDAASMLSSPVVSRQSSEGEEEPSVLPSPSRILVVDDSIPIQKTTARALTREGYSVDIATNGAHCLNLVQKEGRQYDVILMDLQMPVLDGMETTKRIREEEAAAGAGGHHRFIIGVSANSDSAARGQALSAGMDAFIAKPLTVGQLQQCCREVLLPLVPNSKCCLSAQRQ